MLNFRIQGRKFSLLKIRFRDKLDFFLGVENAKSHSGGKWLLKPKQPTEYSPTSMFSESANESECSV